MIRDGGKRLETKENEQKRKETKENCCLLESNQLKQCSKPLTTSSVVQDRAIQLDRIIYM